MTTPKITFMTDVSQAEMDDTCGMKYWLSTFEAGVGIIHKETRIPQAIIAKTVEDLQLLAQMEDISEDTITQTVEEILAPLTRADKEDTPKMELLYRRLGWFAAYALYVEPMLRTLYEDIPTKYPELILDRDPLWVVTRPGRILRSRSSDDIVYREYAFMPPTLWNRKWLQSWHYNIRLHVGIKAAEEELKEPIAYGQMMGLSEGYRSLTSEKLVHPYVWGWYNVKSGAWSHALKSGEGWIPKPVWEYGGGVVQWVKLCGQEVASQQFQMSPPVYANEDILNEWIGRRVHRERQIKTMTSSAHTNPHIRAIHFPRNTSQCKPLIGDACPFLKACWTDRKTRAMPITHDEYIPNLQYREVPLKAEEVGEGVVVGVVG